MFLRVKLAALTALVVAFVALPRLSKADASNYCAIQCDNGFSCGVGNCPTGTLATCTCDGWCDCEPGN